MDLVAAAYHATVHRSAGFTPNKLLFGRELTHPADLVYGKTTDTLKFSDSGEFICRSWRLNKECVAHHTPEPEKSLLKFSRNPVMGWDFGVDDIVYMCLPPGAKMSRKWQGPCRISAKMAPGLLELEYGPKHFLVNANNLKPFSEVAPEKLAP